MARQLHKKFSINQINEIIDIYLENKKKWYSKDTWQENT